MYVQQFVGLNNAQPDPSNFDTNLLLALDRTGNALLMGAIAVQTSAVFAFSTTTQGTLRVRAALSSMNATHAVLQLCRLQAERETGADMCSDGVDNGGWRGQARRTGRGGEGGVYNNNLQQ